MNESLTSPIVFNGTVGLTDIVIKGSFDSVEVWNDSPNIISYSVDEAKSYADLHAMEAVSEDHYCISREFRLHANVAGSACRFKLWSQFGVLNKLLQGDQ